MHGKAMSYNNYVDADSARRAAFDFAEPCVAIIKHSNPCGIAVGTNIAAAHAKALACDPLSAYGGVVAANSAVTDAMAEQITEGFAEVVIAPDFDPAAVEHPDQEVEEHPAAALRAALVGSGRAAWWNTHSFGIG